MPLSVRNLLLEFHYDVNACRNFQLLKSFCRLLSWADNINQPLVCPHFELFTAILVLMSCTQDCDDLLVCRERNRSGYVGTASLCSFYNLCSSSIYCCVLIALNLDSDLLIDCHFSLASLLVLGAAGLFATLPGVSVRQHIKNSEFRIKSVFRADLGTNLSAVQYAPLYRQNYPQTVLYPDSPGFKSDILHENYPTYRRQPFTSSHIYCNHARSIITHLQANCKRKCPIFAIYFVNFLCTKKMPIPPVLARFRAGFRPILRHLYKRIS